MSQHDFTIDNGPGLAVRTDINAAVQALATLSSGPIEPSTKYAGQLWLDTSVAPDGLLRQRNQGNTAWITPTTLPAIYGSIVERFIITSQTWSKPTGLRFLMVEGIGAGGGGSGASATAAAQYSSGAGGGAGGHGKILYAAASLAASVTITIGAAGTATAGAAGGAGGTTSFGALASLNGGGGGTSTGIVAVLTATGGSQGGSSSGWAINGVGQSGTQAIAFFATNYGVKGGGGSTTYGRGGRELLTTASTGEDAAGYGAGGGGATNNPSKSALAGGVGGPAFLHLQEIY